MTHLLFFSFVAPQPCFLLTFTCRTNMVTRIPFFLSTAAATSFFSLGDNFVCSLQQNLRHPLFFGSSLNLARFFFQYCFLPNSLLTNTSQFFYLPRAKNNALQNGRLQLGTGAEFFFFFFQIHTGCDLRRLFRNDFDQRSVCSFQQGCLRGAAVGIFATPNGLSTWWQ